MDNPHGNIPPNDSSKRARPTEGPKRPCRPQSLVTRLTVQRLKALEEETHLLPAQIARLAGVSRSWLGRLLRGEVEPGERILECLHEALEALETTLLRPPRPPAAGDSKRTTPSRRRRAGVILSREQVPALLAVSSGPLASWITWAAETGLRPRELAALRWGDIDLVARTVCLRRSKTDRTPRRLPLSGLLYAWCLHYPKAKPADRVLKTGPGLVRDLAAAGTRAGLGAITPMTIRLSVAAWCAEESPRAEGLGQGADPPTVH